MTSSSLLPYPGGKTRVRHFISEALGISGELLIVFVEPFCGGAESAISLLEMDTVQRIALNHINHFFQTCGRLFLGKAEPSDTILICGSMLLKMLRFQPRNGVIRRRYTPQYKGGSIEVYVPQSDQFPSNYTKHYRYYVFTPLATFYLLQEILNKRAT